MTRVTDIAVFLEQFAPSHLAEDWDNVGLLVGDGEREIARVMTCLTITPESAEEAIASRADLIVAHHPLPFRPLKRVTSQTTPGRLLLSLIEHRIAVYSPHTAFDSAAGGINALLAEGLGLGNVRPLQPRGDEACPWGAGRMGEYERPIALEQVVTRLKQFLGIERMQVVGDLSSPIHRAAVGCGSAGQFLADASQQGCNLLVTGETNFHTCLEAGALGMALVLPGHFASERFAVERLAEILARQFPALTVWASRNERDPLVWV